jgi:hypothetical protein
MQFSENDIKAARSTNLAGYIVTYRLLGLYKELSIKCMEELLNRRMNGDNFNFEEYIEDQLKNSPKPNNLPNIQNILKGLIKS